MQPVRHPNGRDKRVCVRPDRHAARRIYSYNSYLAVCGLHALGHVREAERLAKGMIRAIDTIGDYPESWTDVDGKLALAGPTKSAWTIAVRHALGQGYFDTASGLCEPLLPRL